MHQITINLQIKLIQELRLVQALTESNYKISIQKNEISKYKLLIQKFGVQINTQNKEDIDLTNAIKIGHVAPNTYFGKIHRSLIFPHSLTNYCFSLWKQNRTYHYSFQGLITTKRKNLLEDWIFKNITTKKIKLPTKSNFWVKLRNKLLRTLGINNAIKTKIYNLVIWSSEKGRYYPFKAFDEDYFKVLANSKFVLCPSVDCVWSYLFFEAILCGAIPIVEQHCEVYNGFKYFTFNEVAKDLVWQKNEAEFNYNLCLQKITISQIELNTEIERLIKLNLHPFN